MGKRGRQRKVPNSAFGSSNDNSITLREEKTGKKDQNSNQKKKKNNNKRASIKFSDRLKIEHLEWLASWAAGDAKIPSLAAFYGHRLASVCESLGVSPNPSLFQCERCETVLKPDINCTVKAKKNKVKPQQVVSEKPRKSAQNYLVYTCHFCSHRNLKKDHPNRLSKETGTSKIEPGYLVTENDVNTFNRPTLSRMEDATVELLTAGGPAGCAAVVDFTQNETPIGSNSPTMGGKDEPISSHRILTTNAHATPTMATEVTEEIRCSKIELTLDPMLIESESTVQPNDLEEVRTIDELVEPPTFPITESPATPAIRAGLTLLDAKKRKRKKSMTKKSVGPENSFAPAESEKTVGKPSKRKRKSWTSLKEIVERNEQAKKIYNLSIPFAL